MRHGLELQLHVVRLIELLVVGAVRPHHLKVLQFGSSVVGVLFAQCAFQFALVGLECIALILVVHAREQQQAHVRFREARVPAFGDFDLNHAPRLPARCPVV